MKERIVAEYVSGRRRAAMMKAAPDMIRVVQSIHLQPAQSTIQPLAMGATIGPICLLENLVHIGYASHDASKWTGVVGSDALARLIPMYRDLHRQARTYKG